MKEEIVNLQLFMASTKAVDEVSYRYDMVLSKAIRQVTDDMYAAMKKNDDESISHSLLLVDFLYSLQGRLNNERRSYTSKLIAEHECLHAEASAQGNVKTLSDG